MLSKSKIDKLGEKLKKEESLTEDQLRDLLLWRNAFTSTLDYYHQKLKQKIESGSVVAIAKRIKRIESIKIKLKRFSTMRLSTLQDIAGVRAILKDKDGLEKAYTTVRNGESKNALKRLDDYHYRPKDDGYRGIHFVFESSNSRMVEIQLRTEREHIWATAVEVYGTLQKVSFKTGEGDSDWKEFFKLLSSHFALQEGCTPLKEHEKLSHKKLLSLLKKSINKLKVIERLNSLTNCIQIIEQKRGIGRAGKYALLELDYRNNMTRVDIFTKKDVSKAIKEYTERELSVSDSNIVFVNIDSLESVRIAYPNYFLDTQKLLKILSDIILEGS